MIRPVINSIIRPVVKASVNPELGSSYWIPLSLVVEDAEPTRVIMTGLVVETKAVIGDFTIAGFTVNSLSRDASSKILTLTLSNNVYPDDVLTLVYRDKNYSVTNNVEYHQIGNIITDTFARAALGSDWVENTPATIVALDGSKMIWSHTSGVFTWAEYVVWKNIITLERWEAEIIFKPSENTQYSAGMAIRFKSFDPTNAFDILIQLNTGNTVGWKGTVYIDDAALNVVYQTPTANAITITAGHTYKLRAKRIKNVISIYAKNLNDNTETSGSYTWPVSYPQTAFLPNVGRLGFMEFRGTSNMNYEVSSCIINSDAIINPKTTVIGNSIAAGTYIGVSIADRYFSQVWGVTNTKYNLMASAGLKIAVLDTYKAEILNYKPKYVFMIVGVNDHLTDHTAFQVSYESVLDYYIANEITVVVGKVCPTNNSDIRWINTIIDTICNVRSIKVVDTFTPLVSGASGLNAAYDCGDHLHLNAAGHTVIANTILAVAPELI